VPLPQVYTLITQGLRPILLETLHPLDGLSITPLILIRIRSALVPLAQAVIFTLQRLKEVMSALSTLIKGMLAVVTVLHVMKVVMAITTRVWSRQYKLTSDPDETDFLELSTNSKYKLNVEIGNPRTGTSTTSQEGFGGYRIELLAGGEVIAEDNNSLGIDDPTDDPLDGGIAEGVFATATLSLVTGSTHFVDTLPGINLIGMALGIRLIHKNRIKLGDDTPPPQRFRMGLRSCF